jgi:hypothetical protein
LPHCVATAIRLDDDVDGLDPIKVPSVTLLTPVTSTRNAERANAM